MGKFIDLTGKRFGRLEVIKRSDNVNKETYWLCRCDCGNEKIINGHSLKTGNTKSCGCLGIENARKNCKAKNQSKISDSDMIGKRFGKLITLEYIGVDKHRCKLFKCLCDCGKQTVTRKSRLINGGAQSCGCLSSKVWSEMNYKHGYASHGQYNRVYAIWSHMIDRCYNKNNPAYERYGARGITVCSEWRENVDLFIEWANNNGYSDELSIDRIDNNKGYYPDNCRWVDDITQGNNKRNNVLLTYNEETHTAAEWGRILGVDAKLLRARKSKGWSDERAITEPIRNIEKRNNGKVFYV